MGKKKLSQSFQKWLLLLVITAFLATTAFLWVFQTRLAQNNAVRLLELNIADVMADIQDASYQNMLAKTEEVAGALDEAGSLGTVLLQALCRRYNVTEINCIDENGMIYGHKAGETEVTLKMGEWSYTVKVTVK